MFIFSKFRWTVEILSGPHRTRPRGRDLRHLLFGTVSTPSTRRVSHNFVHTDDDGEKETRVLEEYIKAEEGSSDDERKRDDDSDRGRDRGRGRMRVGDKIEARYRGRSKYYKGKISRVRADGTCAAESNPN